MYIPPSFRMNDQAIPEFIDENPFATLISVDAAGPIINFAPLYFDAINHRLMGHLANNNEQLLAMKHNSVITVIFHGPDGYISPNWYADKAQVPTWNFMSVEIKGKVTLIHGDAEKLQLLENLSSIHEQKILSDWKINKLSEVKLKAMLNAITGLSIQIDCWEGKTKLSQNKPETERLNLIKGLENLDDPKSHLLASKMKNTG